MRSRIVIVCTVLLMGLALACGPFAAGQPSATTTLAPAPTAAGKTATPTGSATAAPVKPTAAATGVAVPPPGGNFSGLWANAQQKTTSATKYRLSLSFIVGTTVNKVFSESPFIVLDGFVSGSDSSETFTGGMVNQLLGGPKIEMIIAGGKSYLRGATMMALMDPSKWYVMPESTDTTPPINPAEMLDLAGGDLTSLKNPPTRTGTESLDGQNCETWSWSIDTSSDLVGLLTDPSQQTDFGVVDTSQTTSWICPDGFVHRVTMAIAGHAKADAAQKGTMKVEAHLWDFNNPSLVVSAPVGAVPFGQ